MTRQNAQEAKCDCEETSCKNDCARNHTHKEFWCEKCDKGHLHVEPVKLRDQRDELRVDEDAQERPSGQLIEDFRMKFLPFYTPGGYEGMPTLVEKHHEEIERFWIQKIESLLAESNGRIAERISKLQCMDMGILAACAFSSEANQYIKGYDAAIKEAAESAIINNK